MENVKVEPILEVPKPETEVEIPGPLYDNFNKAFGWLKADQNPAPRSGTVMDVTYVGTTYVTRPKSVTQIQSEYFDGRIDPFNIGWNMLGVGFGFTLLESIHSQKYEGIQRAREIVEKIKAKVAEDVKRAYEAATKIGASDALKKDITDYKNQIDAKLDFYRVVIDHNTAAINAIYAKKGSGS